MALVALPSVRTQCQPTAADPELRGTFCLQFKTQRPSKAFAYRGSAVRFERFAHFASSEPPGQLNGRSSEDAACCIFQYVFVTWFLFPGSPAPSPPVLPRGFLSWRCGRVLGLSIQPLRVRALSEAFARSHPRRRNVVLRRNQLEDTATASLVVRVLQTGLEESSIEESGDALIPAMQGARTGIHRWRMILAKLRCCRPIGRLVTKGSTTGLEYRPQYDPFDAPEFIEDEHGGGIFSWMPVTAEGGLMPEGEYDEQSFEVPADRLEYLQGAGWLQAGESEDYRAYIVGEVSEVHGRKWQRVVLKGRKDSVREGGLRLMASQLQVITADPAQTAEIPWEGSVQLKLLLTVY
ncbi:unnamed protein product [Symbiodinium sp. CCMP2456]|nr:unnamed protein product [Symbiodinium sp. CCMP2456]